ncbi:hypothetical protein AB0910_08435 [Streptomyces sp. NPDC047002]|uniref:hypothetical protein n=1 Tax=Streptomyces sp. NPDC047002 TaxID=3155475 RepID=UPI0034520A0B
MHIGLKPPRLLGGPLQTRTAGHALLLHPKGEPDPRAVAFASGLAADTQHTLAVVDLPPGTVETEWESVAKTLSGRTGSVRIVFARPTTARESRAMGQRLADRLDRTVVTPDGEVVPTVDGGLFIPSDRGTGWLAYRPGRGPQRDSQRFPKPPWEFSTFSRPWATSALGTVEPLPSGVWVRGPGPGHTARGRKWLMESLPCHPDILTIVLGTPGGPAVPLEDIAKFWETVLPSVRSRVRFVHYGPLSTPEGRAYGQEVADRLGQQVVVYAGIPVETRTGLEAPAVIALHKDGSAESRPFASELMYFPRHAPAARPAPPALFGVRRPMDGIPEITPGVYEYAADAVLEVVQSGLWMRPPNEPADADEVRCVPAGPGRLAILYDRSTPAVAARMKELAEDMLWRLDPATRVTFKVAPADDPWQGFGYADDEVWSVAAATEQAPVVQAPGAAAARRGEGRAGATLQPEAAEAARAEGDMGSRLAGARLARARKGRARPAAAEAPPRPETETASTASGAAPAGAPVAGGLSSEGPAAAPAEPEAAAPAATASAAGTAAAAPATPAAPAHPAGPVPSWPAPVDGAPGAEPVGPIPSWPAPVGPGAGPAPAPAAPGGGSPAALPAAPRPSALSSGGPAAPAPTAPDPRTLPAPSAPAGPAPDAPVPPAPNGPTGGGPTPTAPPNAPAPGGPAPSAPVPPVPVSPAPNGLTGSGPTPAAPPNALTPNAPVAGGSAPSAPVPPVPVSPVPNGLTGSGPAPAAPPNALTPNAPVPGGSAPSAPVPPVPVSPAPNGLTGSGPAPAAPPNAPAPSGPAPSGPGAAGPAAQDAPVPGGPAPGGAAPGGAAPQVPAAPRIRLESGAPAPVPAAPAGDGAAPVVNGAGPGSVPPSVSPQPAAPSAPAAPAAAPAPQRAAVRVQPVPKAAACASPGDREVGKERDWVRRTFSEQYNAVAGSVSRVMSESPGLRGASRSDAAEALTDLVAVKLYLSGDSAQVDRAVRSATVGPHVPLARCVASGLRRLPSYRGPALLRTRASGAERAWFREGRLVTEWGFCAARTNVTLAGEGDTDFLIWSMTARRTSLVDAERPDQIIFVPGTSFKVLRGVDPDAGKPTVLLRELLPSEIDSDGRVDVARVPLDDIALAGLEQAMGIVEKTEKSDGSGGSSAASSEKKADAAGEPKTGGPGSGWPPGLVSGRKETSVRNEGAKP